MRKLFVFLALIASVAVSEGLGNPEKYVLNGWFSPKTVTMEDFTAAWKAAPDHPSLGQEALTKSGDWLVCTTDHNNIAVQGSGGDIQADLKKLGNKAIMHDIPALNDLDGTFIDVYFTGTDPKDGWPARIQVVKGRAIFFIDLPLEVSPLVKNKVNIAFASPRGRLTLSDIDLGQPQSATTTTSTTNPPPRITPV